MERRGLRVARLLHVIGELGHEEPEMGGQPRHPPGAVLWLPRWGGERSGARGKPSPSCVKDWLLAEGLGGQPGLHLELAPYETLTASLLPAQTQV